MGEHPIMLILVGLEVQNLKIQELLKAPDTTLDKRALAIAITNLETAMLWLTNALPD